MFHNAVIYYVPKGVKAILVKFGVSVCRVNEMGWWDEKLFEEESVGSKDSFSILCAKVGQVDNFSETGLLEKGSMENIDVMTVASSISPHHLRVICTPALHNSGRSLCQMDKTLWATWYLEYTLPNRSLWRCFFGGDTGYQAQPNGPVCPIFKEIAQRYGPPDLALLPIAQGSVLPYHSSILPLTFGVSRLVSAVRCSPSHAIQVHKDMGARNSMPIHWGTWTTEDGARTIAGELRVGCKREDVRLRWGSFGKDGFGVGDAGVWLEVAGAA